MGGSEDANASEEAESDEEAMDAQSEQPRGFESQPSPLLQAQQHPRFSTLSSVDDDTVSDDADFTDAADVVERGFVPSVGPSPAFQPCSTDMIVSPMLPGLDSVDEDDSSFALPMASVDVASSTLSSLLG